ncbi:MAG: cell division ATPase MinD [Candidatus Methanospirareceae archaeon]
MPIYSVASGKGGVGKTIFTLNAGAALSEMGWRTLIIDCDTGMATLGQIVNVDSKSEHSLHEVLAHAIDIRDAINHTSYGLDIILSSVSITGFLQADMEKLEEVLSEVTSDYDFILLDTATGICPESLIPLRVCDEVILIVTPELPSLVCAQKMGIIAENMNKKVRGVVINRVKGVKGEIGEKDANTLLLLDILGVIPEDKNMVKAIASKTPLVIKEPNSPAAKKINEVVKKIAEGEEAKEERERTEEKRGWKKLFRYRRS